MTHPRDGEPTGETCCICGEPMLFGQSFHGAYRGEESRHYDCHEARSAGLREDLRAAADRAREALARLRKLRRIIR